MTDLPPSAPALVFDEDARMLHELANALLVHQPDPYNPYRYPDFCRALAERITADRSQLSALREENERLTKLPRWWLPAALDGPFTPTGDGGNDGCVRDVLGRTVADCNGFEARADVIAELLNRASSPPLDRERSNGE